MEYVVSLEIHIHVQELNIDAEEVESLLVACILDSTVHGRIDQVNQILYRTGPRTTGKCKVCTDNGHMTRAQSHK